MARKTVSFLPRSLSNSRREDAILAVPSIYKKIMEGHPISNLFLSMGNILTAFHKVTDLGQ